MKLLLKLFAIIMPLFGWCQVYEPQQLKNDLDFMIKNMESIHPNLYAYTDRTTFFYEYQIVKESIVHPMTRLDFALLVAPVINTLKHGHTNLNLPWDELEDHKNAGGKFIPFNVKIRRDQLFLNQLFYNDSTNLEGARLTEINGISAIKTLNKLRSLLNGERTGYKDGTIAPYFPELYWFIDQSVKDSINVKIEQNGEFLTLNLPRVNLSQPLGTDITKQFELKIIDEKIALIRYNECENKSEFEDFCEGVFKEISEKEIKHLIIDIRDNPGGSSPVNRVIYDYITDKRYLEEGEELIKYSRATKSRYPHLEKRFVESGSPTDSLIRNKPVYRSPKKTDYKFEGEVYLLTSSQTFSSANMMASVFKCNNFGTIIGEETGGITVSYGEAYGLELPNTKLIAGIATKKFVEACGQENLHGVIPDIEVEDSRVIGKDTILNYCIDLISK